MWIASLRPFESVDDETYSDVVKRISTWDTEIEHGTWVERLSHSCFANPALTAEFVQAICSQVSKWAIELDIRDLAEKRLVEEAQYRWVNYRQLFDAAYLGRVDLCEKFLAEFHAGKFDDSAAFIKQDAFDRAIEVAKRVKPHSDLTHVNQSYAYTRCIGCAWFVYALILRNHRVQ